MLAVKRSKSSFLIPVPRAQAGSKPSGTQPQHRFIQRQCRGGPGASVKQFHDPELARVRATSRSNSSIASSKNSRPPDSFTTKSPSPACASRLANSGDASGNSTVFIAHILAVDVKHVPFLVSDGDDPHGFLLGKYVIDSPEGVDPKFPFRQCIGLKSITIAGLARGLVCSRTQCLRESAGILGRDSQECAGWPLGYSPPLLPVLKG
jgi:hypothetical protein